MPTIEEVVDSDHEEQYFDCAQPTVADNDKCTSSQAASNKDEHSTFHDADTWDPFPPVNDQPGVDPADEPQNDINIDEQARLEMEALLSDEQLELMLQEAIASKTSGNSHFVEGRYNEAIEMYDKALEQCPLKYKHDRAVFLCNRAAASLKMEDYQTGIDDCSKALELSPTYYKANYRRALCCEQKEEHWDMALSDYNQVLIHEPNNVKARQAVMDLPPRIAERNERMKDEMMGKLKDLGNMILSPFGLSTDNFKLEDNGQGGYSVKMEK